MTLSPKNCCISRTKPDRLSEVLRMLRRSIKVVGKRMSENSSNALTADQVADQKIVKQLVVCIVAMMGVALVIAATANFMA